MSATDEDRYARQGLIQWWSQERLGSARVLIAGVGALGNEVAKNLALLGVGTLVLVDFDQIERSNLSRTVLFTTDDIGASKVRCATAALQRINPDVAVEAIDGDLFYDLGLGYYRHSDLVIGCLDSVAARSAVGRACSLSGVPYLDGGMWSLGGEVRWLLSGDGPCFDCTVESAALADAELRRSCTGFGQTKEDGPATRVPTVATTSAVVGGLLSQECAKYLCGHPIEAGKSIVYNGQFLTLHRAELARRADCPNSHQPYTGVIELLSSAADTTPADLAAHAREDFAGEQSIGQTQALPPAIGDVTVQLTRSFALALRCPRCGQSTPVNRHWSRIAETERPCPACGTLRDADVLLGVAENSPHANTPLSRLGVPPGEVVPVYVGSHVALFELTADISQVSY